MQSELEKFPTIKNLADDVRDKALEYAASLGARGPRPTTVLGTAVTLAKEWKSGRLPAKPKAAPFLVQPRAGRWVIKRSNEPQPSHTYMRKDDAVRRAQVLAREAGAACFVFGPSGTLIERYEAPKLVVAPEPEVSAEPQAEPVATTPDPVVVALEPIVEAEPVIVPEPIMEAEPVIVPEPIMEAEPEIVPEPIMEAEPEIVPEPEAIRLKKVGRKWLIILGDGRSETVSTKRKATARAKKLAAELNRPFVAD